MYLKKMAVLGGLVMAAFVRSQDLPRFEVTSVKPIRLDSRRCGSEFSCAEAGRFVSRGRGLRPSLLWAYSLQYYQLAGLPQWIDSADAVFDIEAKADGPVTQEQCKLMLQSLLADRFKLVGHRERRD